MNGTILITIFIAAIALMIVAISIWKIHPFLSITGVSLILAAAAGIPLEQIPATLGKGFSSIFTSIGLVIIFGTIIGLTLEKSGAAVKLADGVLKVIGPRYPQLAVMIIGWIISIPVFCDSGFVIVNPIRKSLARRTGVSSVAMTLSLAAGLYASHVFIPPTPGPIAAAGMIGLDDNLLLVIAVGALISIFALIPAYFFARHIGGKVQSTDLDEDTSQEEPSVEGHLPSTTLSVLPIIVPVILMGCGSLAGVCKLPATISSVMMFLGKPVIALIAGFLCTVPSSYPAENATNSTP